MRRQPQDRGPGAAGREASCCRGGARYGLYFGVLEKIGSILPPLRAPGTLSEPHDVIARVDVDRGARDAAGEWARALMR